jgi:hypothetical protein
MRKAVRIALAGVVSAMVLGGAGSAFASGGNDDVIREGSCSMASDWKIKVGTENAGLDGEFEVDSNVVGQTWQFQIKQNGSVIDSGQAVTEAPSGSFEIDFAAANQAGADKFVGLAKNPQTGEKCKGTVTFNG